MDEPYRISAAQAKRQLLALLDRLIRRAALEEEAERRRRWWLHERERLSSATAADPAAGRHPPSLFGRSRAEGDKHTDDDRAPNAPRAGIRRRMGEGRGPKPPASGGFLAASSGTDFSLFSHQQFGKGDKGVDTPVVAGEASVPQISPRRAATGGLIAAPLDPR